MLLIFCNDRSAPNQKSQPLIGTGFFGGEGGIRTHGGPKDHNGFRDRPNRPLWHLSSGGGIIPKKFALMLVLITAAANVNFYCFINTV